MLLKTNCFTNYFSFQPSRMMTNQWLRSTLMWICHFCPEMRTTAEFHDLRVGQGGQGRRSTTVDGSIPPDVKASDPVEGPSNIPEESESVQDVLKRRRKFRLGKYERQDPTYQPSWSARLWAKEQQLKAIKEGEEKVKKSDQKKEE